jgi:hypothetical protein
VSLGKTPTDKYVPGQRKQRVRADRGAARVAAAVKLDKPLRHCCRGRVVAVRVAVIADAAFQQVPAKVADILPRIARRQPVVIDHVHPRSVQQHLVRIKVAVNRRGRRLSNVRSYVVAQL